MGALSKGCGTCKRRKVKCDETHPKCLRCSVAGIECAGYAQRLRYIQEEPRIRRRLALNNSQSQQNATRESNHNLAYCYIPSFPLPVPSTSLTPTLSLSAFKGDIFISFLVHKFFEEERPCPLHVPEPSSCGLPREWTSDLVNTPQKSRSKSWDALAAFVFGQANRSSDVVKSAESIYWQALSELRIQLSNPHTRHSNSTLQSITALYIYQMILSKGQKSMLHIDGLGGVLQSRGPWLLKSHAGKGIFLEHRITLLAKAIISGQRTFLSQPVWKTVPWEDDIGSKSAMDYLIDIIADITNYLVELKAFDGVDTDLNLDWKTLKVKVLYCVEDLNSWWCRWEATHPQAVTETPLPPGGNDQSPSTYLEYDTLRSAYEVCFYNAIRILLQQLCVALQLFPNQILSTNSTITFDSPNSTALLGISFDTLGLAREILRSLRYCYRQSRRFIFAFSFLFIQEVAYGCFEEDSEEARWFVSQQWAVLGTGDDLEDFNLLRRLVPGRNMKLVG